MGALRLYDEVAEEARRRTKLEGSAGQAAGKGRVPRRPSDQTIERRFNVQGAGQASVVKGDAREDPAVEPGIGQADPELGHPVGYRATPGGS